MNKFIVIAQAAILVFGSLAVQPALAQATTPSTVLPCSITTSVLAQPETCGSASSGTNWAYMDLERGTAPRRQCRSLRNSYPNRADDWPQCRAAYKGPVKVLSSGNSSSSPYVRLDATVNTGCSGSVCEYISNWDQQGPLSTYLVNVDLTTKQVYPWYQNATKKFSCFLGGGWGTSVSIHECGVVDETDTHWAIGARYTVTNSAPPPFPTVTTAWLTWRKVDKTSGTVGPINLWGQ